MIKMRKLIITLMFFFPMEMMANDFASNFSPKDLTICLRNIEQGVIVKEYSKQRPSNPMHTMDVKYSVTRDMACKLTVIWFGEDEQNLRCSCSPIE